MSNLIEFSLPFEVFMNRLKQFWSVFLSTQKFQMEDFALIEEFMCFLYPIVRECSLKEIEEVSEQLKNIETHINGEIPKGNRFTLEGFWDQGAKHYLAAETPVTYTLIIIALYLYIKKMNPPSKQWLSVGSGAGVYETFLAEKFPQHMFTSIDFSNEMVALHKKYAKLHMDNQCILQADMCKLPFETASFSGIICNHAIQWVPKDDVTIALKEIKRVLQPEGRLIMIVSPFPSTLMGFDANGKQEPLFQGLSGEESMVATLKEGFSLRYVNILAGKGQGQAGKDTTRVFCVFQKN